MKAKWGRYVMAAGLSSALMVPSMASAAVPYSTKALKEKAQESLWKTLGVSDREKKELAYKKQQEMKDYFSEDTIVVKYEKKMDPREHRKAGTTLVKSIPSLGYDVVKLPKGKSLDSVVSYYNHLPNVVSAAPSITYKTFATTSNDPKESSMYHLSLLNIDKALSMAGNNKVTVAVIDTGIDENHPELKSQILPPYNVLDPAKQPFTDVHGTHVSGIIAGAKDNGIGGHGINPNAKILPIDVFNGMWGTSDYAIAEGILYAVNQKVDVINMSLGGPMESPILEEAVKKAVDAGITVVAAAGNDYGESMSYPAAYPGVISVSATNEQNQLADFSSYGAYVDIAAPGDSIYSSVYDFLKGSSFMKLSGTSMATPIVSGVVSLLKSKYSNLTPNQVDAMLKQSAKDLGAKGYDIKYGFGLVDPIKALSMDPSKLPALDVDNEEKSMEKAQSLTEDSKSYKGTITKPGEIHWVKVDLDKGEGVQAVLNGANNYNYELMFRFKPELAAKKSDDQDYDINDGKNGEEDAGYYAAKEKGTLYVGVKDAYGNYNPDGSSNYELSLDKSELNPDDNTVENPMPISALPFKSSEKEGSVLNFAVPADAEEGDKDYFTFSVDEPQTVKLDLSSVPGINSAISVYFEQDFHMERPEGFPTDIPWEPPAMAVANNQGTGKGEQLVFDAVPGMPYLIEVTSQPRNDFWFDMFMFGPMMTQEKKHVPNSSISYELSADKLDIPADEDNYPMMGPVEEQLEKGAITKEEYMKEKKDQLKEAMAMDPSEAYRYFPEEMVNQIKENAIPFELDKAAEGYFQFSGDQDVYSFTSENDSIYEFTLKKADSIMPWATVFEYDEEKNDVFPVGDIADWASMYGGGEKKDVKRSIALEKGKTYFIQMNNDRYQASDEKYHLSAKWLMDVPADNDVDDNKEIKAKVLKPGSKDENHLVYQTDVDFYYYKNRDKDKLLAVTLNPVDFTPEQLKVLPKEVQLKIVPFLNIVEDTNGNMQIDQDEAGKAMQFGPTSEANLNTNASFRAKKDVGYFFIVNGFPLGDGLSVQPYKIGLNELNRPDEDAKSTVKNNVPSKPLSLKKTSDGFSATAYMNPGVDFGDKDYFSLNVAKPMSYTVNLAGDESMDGVVTIYNAKGQKVGRYDNYGQGDSEVAKVRLTKGNYYFKVEDANGASSSKPYTLTLSK